MEVIFDDMIIYSASQSLIKTVSAGVRFFSVPAKAKAFLFKRKPGYKAHYRFTRTLISIALRNIQLFNMQLTAVSGRGIKNIATCQASNVIAAAGTVAKLAMRQPFVLFKGLTFQKLCLP
ncbi:hypothetical protein BMT96_25085, partial [Escherichia coli]